MVNRRNKFEMAYVRIEGLLGRPLVELEVGDVFRLKANGFMDLVGEVLPGCSETGAKILSLAHYFEQNRDLCQDPEMTIRLFPPGNREWRHLVPSTDPEHGRAEALTFQQAIPPVYQEVYTSPGRYVPALHKQLNSFLTFWLKNLKSQGHRLIESEES